MRCRCTPELRDVGLQRRRWRRGQQGHRQVDHQDHVQGAPVERAPAHLVDRRNQAAPPAPQAQADQGVVQAVRPPAGGLPGNRSTHFRGLQGRRQRHYCARRQAGDAGFDRHRCGDDPRRQGARCRPRHGDDLRQRQRDRCQGVDRVQDHREQRSREVGRTARRRRDTPKQAVVQGWQPGVDRQSPRARAAAAEAQLAAGTGRHSGVGAL